MRLINKTELKRTGKKSKRPVNSEKVGLVLLDSTLNVIAFDRGAAAILNCSGSASAAASFVPQDILDLIRSGDPARISSIKACFQIGKSEYICRPYLVECLPVTAQPAVAIHLEKVVSESEIIFEVGAKYHLTDREQEVLKLLAMGLDSKEVALKMGISPNTVKAFMRMIMIKMGVTTRGAILANVLRNRSILEERSFALELEELPPPSGIAPASRPKKLAVGSDGFRKDMAPE